MTETTLSTWFKDMLDKFKDDPDFIDEGVLLELGEILWDKGKVIVDVDELCEKCNEKILGD